ncbi:hypothetical protein FHW69_003164 [Luteibacter sp. Sphag1AF]|uniref:hypothetical protein n=1 Tax=Luteibacter sp. Sphag1AF TaxID=2587031 RepID=UPI0016196094|nr:hypothetical protein [Luteibacter sp. Sphag1AF]MBB3228522.1 hypothetical protein [Luteibacter sp. Sphag1AF]
MKNIHFIGEWFDCDVARHVLADPRAIQARCMRHVTRRHLPISYDYFTLNATHGVIGAMTGNGIHVVLRTVPDTSIVKADLFVSQGDTATISAAMQLFDGIRDEFRPMRALLHRVGNTPAANAQGRTPRAPTEVLRLSQARRVV